MFYNLFKRLHKVWVILIAVAFLGMVSFFTKDLFGYREQALLMLMLVSLFAMVSDIVSVITVSVVSALFWNFFYIPPTLTFHIGNAEDTLLFFMYFFIALIHAVLTNRIRKAEKQSQEKEEKANAIRLYNTVFNSLSHELKTPVSAIMTAIDTLKDERVRLDVRQKAEVISEMDIAVNRLNHQINNLLNMSRIEAGFLKSRPDWCDVNETITGLIHKFFSPSDWKRIHYQSDEKLPLFKLDRGFLEQILYNVLYNALQYSPPNGIVEVAANNTDISCEFSVKDKGPGFPESELTKVFDKFHRLPDSAPGGSGLGLSIARGFTEAQMGKIWICNNPDGGATINISIPAEMSYVNQLKNE